MIKGNELDIKDWIYSNQNSIIEHYLGIPVNNRLHKSPFRKDKTPTCSFYISNSGRLYFKDWALSETLDCIGIVMKKFDISYREAIVKIESEKHLIVITDSTIYKAYKKWEYVPAHWEDYYFYWKQFHITIPTLSYFNVTPVKAVYVDDDLVARSTKSNPIYAYNNISGRIKFYRPLASKDKKWSGNSTMEDVQGYYQLRKTGKLLIFTKSRKDCMVLFEMGYQAISLNGEGYIPPKELVKDLKSRFKKIIVLYDNDPTGVTEGYKLSGALGCGNIILNKAKDISDLAKLKGISYAHRYLKRRLSKAFRIDDVPF